MTTDRARLARAFEALEQAGYAARLNLACCRTCAWADLKAEHKDEQAVFSTSNSEYHAFACDENDNPIPGADDLIGDLHLYWAGNGELIVTALRAAGLQVEWKHTDEYSIVVKAIDESTHL